MVSSLGVRWRYPPRLRPDELARSGATVKAVVDWGITFPDVASSDGYEEALGGSHLVAGRFHLQP